MVGFNYASDAVAGAIFILFGVALFLIGRRKKVYPVFLAVVGSVPVALGLGLLVAWLFSPSLASRRALVRGALHSLPAEIQEIDIQPYPRGVRTSLTTVPVIVRDRPEIDEIASAMSGAAPVFPNHPQGLWSAWVTVKTKIGQYDFTVEQTDATDNGTLISFMSAIDVGWEIGDFRCDELGTVLQKIQRSRRL